MPQVNIALAAWPLGYESPLSVKNKSKPVLGLVLPNNNLEAPTVKLSSSNARIERLIGRHDLNLLLISIAVTISEDEFAGADHLIRIPQVDPLLQPVLAVVPLQVIAYEMAVARGNDVDQPRNLAKSVTVE